MTAVPEAAGTRLAIFNLPPNVGLGANVFGKDVANFGLFRALTAWGGFAGLDYLMSQPAPAERVAAGLLRPGEPVPPIRTAPLLATGIAAQAGALLRGSAHLDPLAWGRRRTQGDAAYSLIGLVHTLAPPAIREEIGMLATAPLQPWDALVCTSPSVAEAVARLFDEHEEYLGARFGGRRAPPRLKLPVIPLGVEAEAMAARAGRPDIRAATRARLGVAEGDVLLLWVGRLSFFEKAFPQPMLIAAERAARATGAKVHFAMVGWFPDPASQEPMYRAAAAAHAPSVALHLVDGNDPAERDALWAAADIFVSLVDNIQETFGLTPVEAMAAGLPVVVSDWDGYRYTVRDGEDGFLVPTLVGMPGALPEALVGGHLIGLHSYQHYAGAIAQHTAVDVAAAARAFEALIRDPALRRRMGAAGRARVRATFDWPVVARQYRALVEELASLRPKAPGTRGPHPVKGDPFRDFAGFATAILTPETMLSAAAAARDALARAAGLQLDQFAVGYRGTAEEAARILDLLDAGPRPAGALVAAFAADRHRPIVLTLLWMAKLGMISWGG